MEALEPGEPGAAAEAKWHDEILLWGRAGWQQVDRLCRWAQRNGAADLTCPAD